MMSTIHEENLPARKLLPNGAWGVDFRAIVQMAWPLFIYSGIQAVLGITDTWFISTVSVDATAAVGAIFQCINVSALLMGGLGLSVQTLVAQAHGAGAHAKAARLPWSGLCLSFLTWPFFIWLSLRGADIFELLKVPEHLQALALLYWQPMIAGAPILIMLWSMLGHFNGHGRTRVTLAVMALVAVVNALLNWLYLLRWQMGVQGSALATVSALALGLLVGMVLCYKDMRKTKHFSDILPNRNALLSVLALGVPMGIFIALELTGFATFQLMQAKHSIEAGAVTQLVVMLTAVCYWPMIGISMTATTLVGQAAGAGDKDWAKRIGAATVWLGVGYMVVMGVLLAAASPWIVPQFVRADALDADKVVQLTITVLWLATVYHLFDGMNLGFAAALRGAGDVLTPIFLVIPLAWCFFLPLAHALIFAPGEGYVHFLPQYGLGVIGGWYAALVYLCLLGGALWWRWQSGAWKKLNPLL